MAAKAEEVMLDFHLGGSGGSAFAIPEMPSDNG